MRPAAERRTGRRTARAASLGCLAAVALLLILGGLALPARAAPPGVTGEINGPKDLGTHLKGTYTVTATGGPAEAANATQIGFYAFNATIAGRNTTGGFVSPSTGVLTNGSATLVVHAPNATQSLTLYVLVTSGYHGHNESNNLTYAIQVVAPYNLNATLVVPAGATVGPFPLTVTLDGVPVGSIHVPTLTAPNSYPISFAYVNPDLSAGWHTFSVSLAPEHGQVTFPGGASTYSQSFYVPGPPPDNTLWYASGAVAFVGAVFICSTRVAARRRGRAKK